MKSMTKRRFALGVGMLVFTAGGIVQFRAFPLAKTDLAMVTQQAGQQRKRPVLTPTERLRRAIEKSKRKDALLPIMMHTIERGLQGRQRRGSSRFDQAFDQALQRHPGVNREVLQKLVADWKALPVATKAKVIPPDLLRLDASQPISPSAVRSLKGYLDHLSKPLSGNPPTGIGGDPGLSALPNSKYLFLSTLPGLGHIEPKDPNGYQPEETIDLVGRNFSPNKVDDVITIFKELPGKQKGELDSLTPAVASAKTLEFKLPKNLLPGHYYLQVTVQKDGKGEKSNLLDFFVKTPPPPAPEIIKVNPEPQLPDHQILIEGKNFLAGAQAITFVAFNPIDAQPLPPSKVKLPNGDEVVVADDPLTKNAVTSDTQLVVTVPKLSPGKYRIALTNLLGEPLSAWKLYEVKAYKYKLNFLTMHCKDESDPETVLGANTYHDQIVTAWVVGADTTIYSKNTGEYVGFDDGETQKYNGEDRSVFNPNGSPGEVKRALVMSALLFEWDEGDVKTAQEVIGFIGNIVAIAASAEGGGAAGSAVQGIASFVQKLISWFGSDPDPLGEVDRQWSALTLYNLTQNPQHRFTEEINFDNDNSTGSYKLTYEILRVEE